MSNKSLSRKLIESLEDTGREPYSVLKTYIEKQYDVNPLNNIDTSTVMWGLKLVADKYGIPFARKQLSALNDKRKSLGKPMIYEPHNYLEDLIG